MAHGAVAVDRHIAHVADVARSFHRVVFGIQQIACARQHQCFRLDAFQRTVVVPVEAGRVTQMVLVISPALVNPVVRIDPLPSAVLHSFEIRNRIGRVRKLRFLKTRGARDHARQPAGPQTHALLGWRAYSVIATLPKRVCHDGLPQHLQHAGGPGGGAPERDDRHDAVHTLRVTGRPLQGLHAAHRSTNHRDQLLDPEFFGHQPLLGADHVPDVELGELQAGLRRAVGR